MNSLISPANKVKLGGKGLSKYGVFQSSEEYYIKTHILHEIMFSNISFECF